MLQDSLFPPLLVSTVCGLALILAPALTRAADTASSINKYAITIFGGKLSTQDWENSLRVGDLSGSNLVAGALGWTFARTDDRSASFELEGETVKHFGKQYNWEINLLVAGRWHRFPWSDRVGTSLAFGIGPSYATELPKYEVELNGTSEQLLVGWFLEVTLGPPKGNLALSLRLHHRSTGFGLLGEDGGYNALTAGIRYQF